MLLLTMVFIRPDSCERHELTLVASDISEAANMTVTLTLNYKWLSLHIEKA